MFSTEKLEAYTQLGPLQGKVLKTRDISKDWSLKDIWMIGDGSFISTSNPEKCNWLRNLKPASSKEESNLNGFTKKGALFFTTYTEVQAGQEMLFWIDDWNDIVPKKSTLGVYVHKIEFKIFL